MKKSLESLKSKFGQFELSKEQEKAMKGGEPIVILTCENGAGKVIGRGTPDQALAICLRTPDCIGCF